MFKIAKLVPYLRKKCYNFFVTKTSVGRGVKEAKDAVAIQFKGLDSGRFDIAKEYAESAIRNASSISQRILSDKEFLSALEKFAQKTKIGNVNWAAMSEEEIIETVLSKSGVGAGKFAQIISSDKSIMERLSPKLQELIKKTQSDNPFSRTLQEAQNIVDNSFGSVKMLPFGGGGRK